LRLPALARDHDPMRGASRSAAKVAFLAAAMGGAGCATSLASFQPAHVPAQGHVSANAGIDVALPLTTLGRTLDAAKTLAEASQQRRLTDAEELQLFDAGGTLALNPPGPVTHVGITYTPVRSWEVGAHYASAAWRLALRHQVLDQDVDGVDLTIGLGGQRFSSGFPLQDVIPGLVLEDFVRWKFDLPIVIGRHGDFFRIWGGPQLAMSTYSTHLRLELPQQAPVLAGVEGSGFYVAGQGGAAVGYRKVFIAFELTVARHYGTATLGALAQEHDVDLGGWVILPGLALLGEF
jgi:hypothetical protein